MRVALRAQNVIQFWTLMRVYFEHEGSTLSTRYKGLIQISQVCDILYKDYSREGSTPPAAQRGVFRH
jgi:hypothetical protein